MKQAILFMSDKSDKTTLSRFYKLKEASCSTTDVFFLHHQRGQLPESIENEQHFTFTDNILSELGYTPIEDKLLPGSNHFPLLKFFLEKNRYDFYWMIEDDVEFTGNWSYFFDAFKDNKADFLSANIRTYNEDPNWYWWYTLQSAEPLATLEKIKSFNPIYRLSSPALACIDHALKNGWSGHHEVLMPTLLNAKGFSLFDFGGEGTFVPDNYKNRFYAEDTFSYIPLRLGDRHDTLYHPVKEDKKISDVKLWKRNCVISAVGKNSLHRSWTDEESDFDLHLITYEDCYNQACKDADFVSFGKGYKPRLVYNYLMGNPEYLEHYDYFFIPDDDIRMDAANISKLFRIMEQENLSIAQPALSDSYYTFEHTMRKRGSLLRYTNFVEMMVPCFSREALKKVLPSFNENISGWGIDYHWSHLIGFTGREMAVIDDIHTVHTRPIQSGSQRNVNELHAYLQKYNLSPQVKIYGEIPLKQEPADKHSDWRPIIASLEKQRLIEERLEVISQLLLSALNNIESIGLAQGKVGISLFFFEYYRLTGKRKYYDIGLAIFKTIYLSINQIADNIYFPDGLSGISWAVEYLAQNGFIEPETDEILDEICSALNANNPLDLPLHKTSPIQIIGYGMHYLARMQNPMHRPDLNKNHLADKFITFQIVDYFVGLKEQGYFLNEIGHEGRESLAAIILYLSHLLKLKIDHSKIEQLIADYVEMAIQLIHEEDGNNTRNKLLSACAFLHAAHAANRSDWKQQASILLNEVGDNQLIFSPKYGISKELIQAIHLCSCIHQYIPEGKYKDHAELLIDEMLTPDIFGKLIQELISNAKFGMQDGIAEIGIILIASIADFELGENKIEFFHKKT